jgi:hypothetical protein
MPNPKIETVQHPSLGTLQFPVDMPFSERNQMIQEMEQKQNAKFTPPANSAPKGPKVSMQDSFAGHAYGNFVESNKPIVGFGKELGHLVKEDLPGILFSGPLTMGISGLRKWYEDVQTYRKTGQVPVTSLSDALIGLLGVDKQRVEKNSQEHDYPALAADTFYPIAKNILTGRAVTGGRRPTFGGEPSTITPSQIDNFVAAVNPPNTVNGPAMAKTILPALRETALLRGALEPSVADMQGLISPTVARLEGRVAAAKLKPGVGTGQVAGDSIADAIEATIDPYMQQINPAAADAIRAKADTFRRPMTLDELDTLRRNHNALAEVQTKNRQKSNKTLAANDPGNAALLAEGTAIRDLFYNALELYSGENLAPVRRTEGAMLNIRPSLNKRVNRLDNMESATRSQRLFPRIVSQVAKRGPIKGTVNALINPSALDTANTQMQNAFGNLGPNTVPRYLGADLVGNAHYEYDPETGDLVAIE